MKTQYDYWKIDHDRVMDEMGRAMAEKIDQDLLNTLLWESTVEQCKGWTPVELKWEKGKDTSYFWNEACAWAIEQFGLPGENYVTHPTEENMLFLNRQTSLDFDDMLASLSSGAAGGVAYGLFENSEEMALNLGFSGFRRGSYDFYKTDWKYLNDASTRGAVAESAIDGILVPAGTSTVYDQILGTNIRRPFLHVRYRASQADDRRMKSWVLGSVGGAYTSDLDAMEVNFLSERCLCVQGANNFVLFTSSL